MNIVKNEIKVTQNSYKDEGEGIVSFPKGLCISDNQVQRNGTRYDIDSLDTSHYSGMLTADHEDKLKNIIGRVEGLSKGDGRLTVNRIVYAVKQNPYARLAYDLLVGGFSNAFSTETVGVMNEADGVLRNHELVGLSQVVCPNNYSAVINTVRNSLEKAKEDGLDVSGIEDELLKKENQMDETNKAEEVKTQEVEVSVDQVANKASKKKEEEEKVEDTKLETLSEDLETKESPKAEEEVVEEDETKSETDTEAIEEDEEEKKKKKNTVAVEKNEISDAQVREVIRKLDELLSLAKDQEEDEENIPDLTVEEIVDEYNKADEKAKNEAETDNKEEQTSMNAEEVKNAVEEVLKGYFKNEAKAPTFQKAENSTNTDFATMDWRDRYNKQVAAAYNSLRLNDVAAQQTLREINQVNFNALKEAGIARNSMTIESMGNFVIPPEMYDEIIGQRTDYSAILDATDWRETRSLEFAWLKRNGDIDMKNVAMCDDGKNGNLKPISEYTAEPVTSKLEEMAAVTVVCNAATRFFAVDLLADVAAGYRNDYDRKRAQLVIARLQQAAVESGQTVTYAPKTDTEAMLAWLEAIAEISDTTTNGTLVFNNKTYAQLKAHALAAGANGPLSQIFVDGDMPKVFGTRLIVVPNDLMPTIESNDQVSFIVDGEAVNITCAVFYADLSAFTGYTSGGLQYDVSADASYEVDGATRSAYQRNELVLRGSFFRGGAVKDITRVSGILQQAPTTNP